MERFRLRRFEATRKTRAVASFLMKTENAQLKRRILLGFVKKREAEEPNDKENAVAEAPSKKSQ